MHFSISTDLLSLEKWDDFVLNNSSGTYLQYSNWLDSYRPYGFSKEIIIGEEDDEICIGYGAVIAKLFLFKFYIIPAGPIGKENNEKHLEQIINFAKDRAEKQNCCYFQITLPLNVESIYKKNLFKIPNIQFLNEAVSGNLFRYVFSYNGLNWIDLSHGNLDAYLMSLSSKARRDIRSSERKNLICRKIKAEFDIKMSYDLFEDNAKRGNYSIRDWNSFGATLIALIKNGKGVMLGAYQGNILKGAIFLIDSGNYFTYVMGGTKKENPDVLAGYFLQWQAIQLSLKHNYLGYNISLGGSDGVVRFKKEFNPIVIQNNQSFHWILMPMRFLLFRNFEKYLKPHKKFISRIISKFKK
jgi:lipid II:glycine glycyltransferase (peptidoglycan interpeptide bridge formation enzyme)